MEIPDQSGLLIPRLDDRALPRVLPAHRFSRERQDRDRASAVSSAPEESPTVCPERLLNTVALMGSDWRAVQIA